MPDEARPEAAASTPRVPRSRSVKVPAAEEPHAAGTPADGVDVITDGDLIEAIGAATLSSDPGDSDGGTAGADAARVTMLRRLLADPASRFRPWTRGDDAMVARLQALDLVAPNFAEATAMVVRAAHLSRVTGTPLSLAPLVLYGPPGLGKSFYARRLGEALATSVTAIAGTLLTERGAISGLGPVWKGAHMGCAARALLTCRTSVPVLYIDELDKMQGLLPEDRPLDALLPLLEPETARAFVDDYVGCPARADLIAFVMTANDLELLSSPLRDRIVAIQVPDLTDAERERIARRVFEELNAAHSGAFDGLGRGAVSVLAGLRTRRLKGVLTQAMGYAAAGGRREVRAEDVEAASRLIGSPEREPIGFRFKTP